MRQGRSNARNASAYLSVDSRNSPVIVNGASNILSMIRKANWTGEKEKNCGMKDEIRHAEYKLQEKYRK